MDMLRKLTRHVIVEYRCFEDGNYVKGEAYYNDLDLEHGEYLVELFPKNLTLQLVDIIYNQGLLHSLNFLGEGDRFFCSPIFSISATDFELCMTPILEFDFNWDFMCHLHKYPEIIEIGIYRKFFEE